ncbi:MAG: 5-(carboxyamino)imidazole ribonucleotide synthase [Desulfurococcaceae archaeon]
MKFSIRDLNDVKIGILGSGQLGWMMILENRKYPLKFYVMGAKDDPACKIADKCYDPDNYRELIDSVDVVTFEFEHVYEDALRYAEYKEKLLPRLQAVELKRERWRERLFFKEHGIPTPRFHIVDNVEEAFKIVREEFNYHCVIKQSKGGYDGKGQYFIKNKIDLEKYEKTLLHLNDILVVEEYVDFDYEASIIVARNINGEFVAYPPTYNHNEKGILVYNYGPLQDKEVFDKMIEIARRLCEKLNYIGTMGIEFFVKNKEVLVNEFAPRVHNTGHYTLDVAFISQFEQHIRSILGLELAPTMLLSSGGMVNIIGLDLSDIPLEVNKYGKLYWYGKKEVRKRRKMGHVNVVGRDLVEVKHKVDMILKLLYPNGPDL